MTKFVVMITFILSFELLPSRSTVEEYTTIEQKEAWVIAHDNRATQKTTTFRSWRLLLMIVSLKRQTLYNKCKRASSPRLFKMFVLPFVMRTFSFTNSEPKENSTFFSGQTSFSTICPEWMLSNCKSRVRYWYLDELHQNPLRKNLDSMQVPWESGCFCIKTPDRIILTRKKRTRLTGVVQKTLINKEGWWWLVRTTPDLLAHFLVI